MWESAEIGRQSMASSSVSLAGMVGRGRPRRQVAEVTPFRRAAAVEPAVPLWHTAPALGSGPGRCRSSVVEHPLGKGEVHSSILCGSTTLVVRQVSGIVVQPDADSLDD